MESSFCSFLKDKIGWTQETCKGELSIFLKNEGLEAFQNCTIFESNFEQVTKKGYVAHALRKVTKVTLGILASNPNVTLPEFLIMAQPISENKNKNIQPENTTKKIATPIPKEKLELTRLLPLRLIKLSVLSRKNYCLRLRIAFGGRFYLKLSIPDVDKNKVFAMWVKLIKELRHFDLANWTVSDSDTSSDDSIVSQDKTVIQKVEENVAKQEVVHREKNETLDITNAPLEVKHAPPPPQNGASTSHQAKAVTDAPAKKVPADNLQAQTKQDNGSPEDMADKSSSDEAPEGRKPKKSKSKKGKLWKCFTVICCIKRE
ncbi:protein FAM71B-like [Protopterus annectens]|uniref:protein FAM71B-like n=1 Tax=Protopterus annectens TaxID=7888 RepID=UPI001CFAB6F7|nr:protein FAM71B-like [Protopterus annectens]